MLVSAGGGRGGIGQALGNAELKRAGAGGAATDGTFGSGGRGGVFGPRLSVLKGMKS